MRAPVLLLRQVGLLRFLVIQCLTLGVFATALLYPFLLLHALWLIGHTPLLQPLLKPLPAIIAGFSAASFLLGYATSVACAARGLRDLGYLKWHATLAAMPLYWLLMTPAAWLALWDFLVRPHHWHKTEHGLSALLQPAAERRAHDRVVNRASSP